MQNYIISSIETHLFFARIMKEHALFLEAGFPCCNQNWIRRCDWFKQQFENLLFRAIRIADETVGSRILNSCELTTEFTLAAEQATQALSGIPINQKLTVLTNNLRCGNFDCNDAVLFNTVHQMNQQALPLIRQLIDFKESILREVENQRLYTSNYPLLIKHILREARLYHDTINELYLTRKLTPQSRADMECFWNQIMMEHALFIRGLLDPSEEELICAAHDFAMDFKSLLNQAIHQEARANQDCFDSLSKTREIRDFKSTGTNGIIEGKVSSLILPLLADHVLREANHYIRILEDAEYASNCR